MANPGGFRPNPQNPGAAKTHFARLAEARLAEFKCLSAGNHFVAAVYMAGYVVEALLKCAICKTLDSDELPKNFEMHDLETLRFLAGLEKKMDALPQITQNFRKINALWDNAKLRYKDPADPSFDAAVCANVDKYLTDPNDGLIVWLKRII